MEAAESLSFSLYQKYLSLQNQKTIEDLILKEATANRKLRGQAHNTVYAVARTHSSSCTSASRPLRSEVMLFVGINRNISG